MGKKKRFFKLLVCMVFLCMAFIACQEELFVPVDETIFECDYTSGTETVTVSELPAYTGTSLTQDEFESDFVLNQTKGMLTTMLTAMDQVIDSTLSEKSASGYAAFAIAISDETVSLDGAGYPGDLMINSLNGSISGSNSYTDGIFAGIIEYLSSGMETESATQDFGPVNSVVDLKLDFDIECNVTGAEESSTISLFWRHSNQLTSTLTDANFTIDTETGAYSTSGTCGIQSTFATTIGMTKSGYASGNAKFILTIVLSDIDFENASIDDLATDMTAAIESGEVTSIDSLIKSFFFANADNYLSATITAYDNNNNVISSVVYSGLDLLTILISG